MVASIEGDDVLKVAHLQNIVTPQCCTLGFGTLKTLFHLQLFCHAGFTDGGFTSTTEVKTVKWEHS